MIVIPRGFDPRPRGLDDGHVLLFEPAGTLNTGTAGGGRTVDDPKWV